MGYAPNNNAFKVFAADNDSSVDTATAKEAPNTITAGTAGSTLGSTLGSTYQASIVPGEPAGPIPARRASLSTDGGYGIPTEPSYYEERRCPPSAYLCGVPAGRSHRRLHRWWTGTPAGFNKDADTDVGGAAVTDEGVRHVRGKAVQLLLIMSPREGDTAIFGTGPTESPQSC
jgi:hypothetical protein